MAKALVLGATGHIGAHIVRALLRDRHQVRAAYRNDRHLHVIDHLPIDRVRVDLDTMEGLREALDGCDWVFHAASYYPNYRERPDRAVQWAITSVRQFLTYLQAAAPSRLVFTSSASTIRSVPGRSSTERDEEAWPPARGLSLYATVKVAMEREVRQAAQDGLPAVIVNPSICLGEHDAHRFSGRAVLVFAKGRTPFYLDQMMNFIYTGDAGVGHVRAAERGGLGERYLLTAHAMPMREFAALVARAAGVAAPRWRLPHRLALAVAAASEGAAWVTRSQPFLPRAAVPSGRASRPLDGTKAWTELALPRTPLEEAVRRTLDWFRQHGDL